MMGCKIAHGTTFRRAVEEGLLDLKRVVQIGLRGTSYTPTDFQWSVDQVPLFYLFIIIVICIIKLNSQYPEYK